MPKLSPSDVTSSKALDPNSERHWLGVDVGGTKILTELFDAQLNAVAVAKRRTRAERGQEATVQRIIESIERLLAESPLERKSLAGIGLGCPGVLDLKRGMILESANLGWMDVPLHDILAEHFQVPVRVGNDVDMGVYGESVMGAGQGARCVLGLFIGTGIGGGLVLNQEIFHGSNRSCMEVGHMEAVPNGARCGCGRWGCLEAVAGRLAIASQASAAVLRGQAPWLAEHVGSDPAQIKSSALASSIAHGDAVIQEIVEHACSLLGGMLGDLVNLLAPDVIVLGGGMAEAMPDLFAKHIRKSMRRNMMPALAEQCKLSIAQLGDHAATLGAAAWVRRHVEMT